MKSKKKEIDILEVLYLDFLNKYEGALRDYADRANIAKGIAEGKKPSLPERANYIQLAEGRAEAYRDCLMRINEFKKMKENGDL